MTHRNPPNQPVRNQPGRNRAIKDANFEVEHACNPTIFIKGVVHIYDRKGRFGVPIAYTLAVN